MIPIKDETRLIDLTIGELKSVLSNIIVIRCRDVMSRTRNRITCTGLRVYASCSVALKILQQS